MGNAHSQEGIGGRSEPHAFRSGTILLDRPNLPSIATFPRPVPRTASAPIAIPGAENEDEDEDDGFVVGSPPNVRSLIPFPDNSNDVAKRMRFESTPADRVKGNQAQGDVDLLTEIVKGEKKVLELERDEPKLVNNNIADQSRDGDQYERRESRGTDPNVPLPSGIETAPRLPTNLHTNPGEVLHIDQSGELTTARAANLCRENSSSRLSMHISLVNRRHDGWLTEDTLEKGIELAVRERPVHRLSPSIMQFLNNAGFEDVMRQAVAMESTRVGENPNYYILPVLERSHFMLAVVVSGGDEILLLNSKSELDLSDDTRGAVQCWAESIDGRRREISTLDVPQQRDDFNCGMFVIYFAWKLASADSTNLARGLPSFSGASTIDWTKERFKLYEAIVRDIHAVEPGQTTARGIDFDDKENRTGTLVSAPNAQTRASASRSLSRTTTDKPPIGKMMATTKKKPVAARTASHSSSRTGNNSDTSMLDVDLRPYYRMQLTEVRAFFKHRLGAALNAKGPDDMANNLFEVITECGRLAREDVTPEVANGQFSSILSVASYIILMAENRAEGVAHAFCSAINAQTFHTEGVPGMAVVALDQLWALFEAVVRRPAAAQLVLTTLIELADRADLSDKLDLSYATLRKRADKVWRLSKKELYNLINIVRQALQTNNKANAADRLWREFANARRCEKMLETAGISPRSRMAGARPNLAMAGKKEPVKEGKNKVRGAAERAADNSGQAKRQPSTNPRSARAVRQPASTVWKNPAQGDGDQEEPKGYDDLGDLELDDDDVLDTAKETDENEPTSKEEIVSEEHERQWMVLEKKYGITEAAAIAEVLGIRSKSREAAKKKKEERKTLEQGNEPAGANALQMVQAMQQQDSRAGPMGHSPWRARGGRGPWRGGHGERDHHPY